MRPKFTGLIDRTVIETLLEEEGSALSPDVSAMASPGKESKPHQFPPRTAKPVLLSGQLSLAHLPGPGPAVVPLHGSPACHLPRERVSPHCVGKFKRSNARRTGMLRSEGRDLVTDIEDRLIELYVQQDEARRTEDRDQARGLQVEIDKPAAQREEIRRRP
jgi:hypothetical protein